MKIFVKKGKLADTKSQTIILTLFEDSKKLTGVALEIDKKSDGLISELIENGDFQAKPSQISVTTVVLIMQLPVGLNLPSKHRELPLADSSIQLYTGNPYFTITKPPANYSAFLPRLKAGGFQMMF